MAGRVKPEARAAGPERAAPKKAGRAEKQKQAAPAKTGKGQKKPPERERRELTSAEWRKIRIEYVKGKTTYRELAEKYGVTVGTIGKHASKEGWKKRRQKLDEKTEKKALERVCDARAKEFEQLARINDQATDALENLLAFVRKQPPRKYDDLRGVESLTKAIAQVVQIKRDLYNLPGEVDKARIESLREKAKLERQKFEEEQAEKAANKSAAAATVFKVIIEGEEVGPLDE